jgi:Mn-containing catalase
MKGILEEGEETIKEGENQDDLGADLALIAAAQKVEHYEICGYGTARTLARQIGEVEIAKTLSRTLGEDEASDFLLTNLTKPIMQQMTSIEVGNGTRRLGENLAKRKAMLLQMTPATTNHPLQFER